jgi:hypothetical protein
MWEKLIFRIRFLRKVGWKNYIFFFIYLKGDEFSKKLSLIDNVSIGSDGKVKGITELERRRKLAHDLDIIEKDLHNSES